MQNDNLIESNFTENVKSIWERSGSKTPFHKWIHRVISRYDFEEEIDYTMIIIDQIVNNSDKNVLIKRGPKAISYFFTKKAASKIEIEKVEETRDDVIILMEKLVNLKSEFDNFKNNLPANEISEIKRDISDLYDILNISASDKDPMHTGENNGYQTISQFCFENGIHYGYVEEKHIKAKINKMAERQRIPVVLRRFNDYVYKEYSIRFLREIFNKNDA
jgi:phage anti-repressor protein